MKSYPSIGKDIRTDLPFYIFDKIDGSNIRAEWSRKNGFYKFGTRRRMLDESEQPLGEAISLIRNGWESDLSRIFKSNRFERAVAFFEFHGPNSFAGCHEEENHKVNLLDVDVYKRGILQPSEFLKLFGDLDIAPYLGFEKINQDLVFQVKKNLFPGMTFEGVVCKANNPNKKHLQPLMFKIKSEEWLDKLKNFCNGNEELYRKLA